MRQKGSSLLPVIIIIALIGIVGYLIYQNTQLQKIGGNLVSPSTVPTETLPKTSPTIDPTANWKIYNNEATKYSIKYPSYWNIFEVPTENLINQLSDITFNYNKSPNLRILVYKSDSVFYKNASIGSANFPEYTIGGKMGTRSVTTGEGPNSEDNSMIIYMVNNGDLGFYILAQASGAAALKQNEQLFDQILSTFKFID